MMRLVSGSNLELPKNCVIGMTICPYWQGSRTVSDPTSVTRQLACRTVVRSGSVRYKADEWLTPEGPLANRCRLAARMPSRGFLFEPDLNARRRTGGRRKNSPRSETVRAPGGNRPPSTAAGGRLDLAVGRA